MIGWLVSGLRGRRLTTRYPRHSEAPPSSFRGRAALAHAPIEAQDAEAVAEACLPGALTVASGHTLRLDATRCINCGLCVAAAPDGVLELQSRYELATDRPGELVAGAGAEPVEGNGDGRPALRRALPRPFRRSIHIRHIDTGSDGAVEQEIAALLNPYYDMHRLGLFFTATPRHADILLVTGPVTVSMEKHLRRTYEAMPDPRIVVAAGTDACSGGIWSGPNIRGGVDRVLPVDVYIPGDPPAPITLLHGLLLATGRVERAPAPVRREEAA
jgi:Ni,Fe-hydrogenase III small subunit/NAD-dependent dihydropyrimidine dehydrogenase PreA subunit